MSWFGPWFPRSWWGPWFPQDTPLVVPPPILAYGPSGAAVLMFDWEEGAKVTYSWITDIQPSYSGKERRRSRTSAPRQTYQGSALLLSDAVLANRSLLVRYAALGRPFTLGLPWEELTLSASATGTTLHVWSTATCDWAQPSQRVIVISPSGETFQSTIQSVTATTIVVVLAPGSIGRAGGRVMPAMSVYLDPQVGFARYGGDDTVERWQLTARAAVDGFAGTPPVAASLSLADPVTHGSETQLVTLVARSVGVDGNGITVRMTDDSLGDTGELDEDTGARTVHLKYSGGATTMADLVALLAASELIGISGTYTPTAIMAPADDEFTVRNLTGGANRGLGAVGAGATVVEYDGHPVFDRGLNVEGTAGDSMQAMTEILDMGGLLTNVGKASTPDWGRAVAVARSSLDDRQWLKAFLFMVRGRHRAFWLPTYREDLTVAP